MTTNRMIFQSYIVALLCSIATSAFAEKGPLPPDSCDKGIAVAVKPAPSGILCGIAMQPNAHYLTHSTLADAGGIKNVSECGRRCLSNTACTDFTHNTQASKCRLLSRSPSGDSKLITSTDGTSFYNRHCFETLQCFFLIPTTDKSQRVSLNRSPDTTAPDAGAGHHYRATLIKKADGAERFYLS